MISEELSKELPHFVCPGKRVKFERKVLVWHKPRVFGYGTVQYEWLCLDEIAVVILLDNGEKVTVFPGLGDKIKVVNL